MDKSNSKEGLVEFIIFKSDDDKVAVHVRLQENDIWLTQDQLASLYGVERPGIT